MEGWSKEYWDRFHEIVDDLEPLPPDLAQARLDGLEREAATPREVIDAVRLSLKMSAPAHPRSGELQAGAKVAGKYTVIDRIGVGGMGVVYRARQEAVNRIVALKVIRPGLISKVYYDRFQNEIESLGRLEVPGIVRVYDAGWTVLPGEQRERPYLVMQFVSGTRLDEYVSRTQPSILEVVQLVERISESVQSAHEQKIAHRDLKPSNILVDTRGEPIVVDFGLAAALVDHYEGGSRDDPSQWRSGTLAYMSPERLSEKTAWGFQETTDVYSLAAMLYQLAFKEHPYCRTSGDDRTQVLDAYFEWRLACRQPGKTLHPDRLYRVLLRAMAPDPRERFFSAASFARAIRECVSPERSESDHSISSWTPSAGARIPSTEWVLERQIGEGGTGVVWIIEHQRLRVRRVAKFCVDEDKLKYLKREITFFRALRTLGQNSPFIVPIFDVSLHRPPFYLLMEHVDGGDLESWAKRNPGLSLELRSRMMDQVAAAVQSAHRSGVIHRDIKPTNILVDESAAPYPVAKLTDFGIGTVLDPRLGERLTLAGFTKTTLHDARVMGTVDYIAPESLRSGESTVRSDLYSLGVVWFRWIVEDFEASLVDWREKVGDPILREDLSHLLASDPEGRWTDVGSFRTALQTYEQRMAKRQRAAARTLALTRLAWVASILLVFLGGGLLADWISVENQERRKARAMVEGSLILDLPLESPMPPSRRSGWLDERLDAINGWPRSEQGLAAIETLVANKWPVGDFDRLRGIAANLALTPGIDNKDKETMEYPGAAVNGLWAPYGGEPGRALFVPHDARSPRTFSVLEGWGVELPFSVEGMGLSEALKTIYSDASLAALHRDVRGGAFLEWVGSAEVPLLEWFVGGVTFDWHGLTRRWAVGRRDGAIEVTIGNDPHATQRLGANIESLFLSGAPVAGLEYSSSGERLLSWLEESYAVVVWEPERRPFSPLNVLWNDAVVERVVWGSLGDRFAVSYRDKKEVVIWDALDREKAWRIEYQQASVKRMAFSSDDRWFVVQFDGGELDVLDLGTKRVAAIGDFDSEGVAPGSQGFLASRDQLQTLGQDGKVRTMGIERSRAAVRTQAREGVGDVVFLGEGRVVAVSASDGITFLDGYTGIELASIPQAAQPTWFDRDHTGAVLVGAQSGVFRLNTIHNIVDRSEPEPTAAPRLHLDAGSYFFLEEFPQYVSSSGDGTVGVGIWPPSAEETLADADVVQQVVFFDIERQQELYREPTEIPWARVELDGDGDRSIMIQRRSDAFAVFNWTDGRHEDLWWGQAADGQVFFVPNQEDRIIYRSPQGQWREVDAATGRGVKSLALGDSSRIAISAEGRYLFAWNRDDESMIWDRVEEDAVVRFPQSAASSPIQDSWIDVTMGRLAWWEESSQLMVWDLTELQRIWGGLGMGWSGIEGVLPGRDPSLESGSVTIDSPSKTLRPSAWARAERSESRAPFLEKLDWALSVAPGDAELIEGLLSQLESMSPGQLERTELKYLSGVAASLLARGHGRSDWLGHAERTLSDLRQTRDFRLYPDAVAHLAVIQAESNNRRLAHDLVMEAYGEWNSDATRALAPMAETLWLLGRWRDLEALLAEDVARYYLSRDDRRHGRRPELVVALRIARRALDIRKGVAVAGDPDWERDLDTLITEDPLLDDRHPLVQRWRDWLHAFSVSVETSDP